MALVNEFFLELPKDDLYSRIAKELKVFSVVKQSTDLIDLSVNEVSNFSSDMVVNCMHGAVDDMSRAFTGQGSCGERGESSLIDTIIKNDFNTRGIHLLPEEIFVNDGIKSEIGNIGEILGNDNSVGVADPIYPVYVESNVISGRAGIFTRGHWSNVVYLDCPESAGFAPQIPDRPIDIVYLCSPNNPTGMAFSKSQLRKWVDYALKNNTLILFDATYEAYIQSRDIPHSIYEIRGAKKVAIELRSFSHMSGFTDLHCGYTVIPKELSVQTLNGKPVCMNTLWTHRQRIRSNGVPYVTQRAAVSLYSDECKAEMRRTIDYYMENVMLLRRELSGKRVRLYGGEHVPFLWFKIPHGQTSWEYFRQMLYGANVICVPGNAYGPGGEGYVRLSGFSTREDCCEAAKRLKNWL